MIKLAELTNGEKIALATLVVGVVTALGAGGLNLYDRFKASPSATPTASATQMAPTPPSKPAVTLQLCMGERHEVCLRHFPDARDGQIPCFKEAQIIESMCSKNDVPTRTPGIGGNECGYTKVTVTGCMRR